MASYGERAVEFSQQMSDTEALLWNIEKDPWLASTMGTVAITDRPLDVDRFRAKLAAAVAAIPRLRARVMPQLGRLTAPTWEPDAEFDLGYHLLHLAVPSPGDDAALFDLAARLLEEPFDRTRPLWRFFVVDGLSGGRGALVVKLHHSLTDGLGAVRLAEQYMDLGREAPAPPPVDLDAVLAADLAARVAGPEPEPSATTAARQPAVDAERRGAPVQANDADRGLAGLLGSLLSGTADAARRPAGLVRRLAADAMLAVADPARVPEWGEEAWATVRHTMSQLDPNGPGAQSPLWGRRSRRRVLRPLSVELERTRAAAKALGVSVNDLFVAGAALAAASVHRDAGLTLDQVTITFVVSTRHGVDTAGNAFTPAKVTIPTGTDAGGSGLELAPFARQVSDALAAGREQVSGGGGLLATLAGVVNLLPTSLVTRLARAQAQAVDFATSNLRAAPFPVFIAGAQVLATYPVGPVAGTAFNVTMMSYVDRAYLGVHMDPAAVAEPDALVQALEAGYARLLAAAPAEQPSARPEVKARTTPAKRASSTDRTPTAAPTRRRARPDAPAAEASPAAAGRKAAGRRPPSTTPRPRANRRRAGGA